MDYQSVASLTMRSLRSGAQPLGGIRYAWRISGNCKAPVLREVYGRPAGKDGDKWHRWAPYEAPHSLLLEMTVRCRRCDNCRRYRAWGWQLRASAELGVWPRTWFGTLTLSPEAQTKFLAKARMRASRNGDDFDALPYWQQFDMKVRAISNELTKMLKRIRKNSGAKVRYLLVAEPHKSGEPHFHMLLHEVTFEPVRYEAHLRHAWLHGFAKWKLVEPGGKTAGYIAKYLSKSSAARVRASKDYGKLALSEVTRSLNIAAKT